MTGRTGPGARLYQRARVLARLAVRRQWQGRRAESVRCALEALACARAAARAG